MVNSKKRVLGFLGDRGGNVGIFFGLCLTPAVLCVGSAVDFAVVFKTQLQLQKAADAGALAAAGLGASATAQQRTDLAGKLFAADTQDTNVLGVTPQITSDGSSVTVQATKSVPMSFLKIAGINSMTVRASRASVR